MNTHKFTLNQLLLLILGFLLLIGRSIWEYLLPIRPTDFKGIMYFRDILILLPATILIGSVLIRTKYHKSLSHFFDFVISKIRSMKNKPIGITTFLSFKIYIYFLDYNFADFDIRCSSIKVFNLASKRNFIQH